MQFEKVREVRREKRQAGGEKSTHLQQLDHVCECMCVCGVVEGYSLKASVMVCIKLSLSSSTFC